MAGRGDHERRPAPLTPDEADDVADRMWAIVEEYRRTDDETAQAPDGTRRVNVQLQVFPAPRRPVVTDETATAATTAEPSRRPLVALLGAYGISLVGSRLSMIALPLFVLATTGSATRTGILAMVEMAPYVVGAVRAQGRPAHVDHRHGRHHQPARRGAVRGAARRAGTAAARRRRADGRRRHRHEHRRGDRHRRRHRLPRRATFTVSFFLIGGPRFAVLGLGAPLWAVLTVVFVGGIGTGTINPILGAVEIERVPERLRARVLSLMNSCAWTLIPFGGLVGGLLSDHLGVSTALLVCGADYTVATTVPALRPEWAETDDRRSPVGEAHPARVTAA